MIKLVFWQILNLRYSSIDTVRYYIDYGGFWSFSLDFKSKMTRTPVIDIIKIFLSISLYLNQSSA